MSAAVAEILPFEGGGSFPVQYEVDVAGSDYYVRYRGSWLTIDKDNEQVFEQCLNKATEDDGEWNNEETTVYLFLISRAILSGGFTSLVLPDKDQAKTHPMIRPGPYPVYVFLNCEEKHEHDMTTCPTVPISPMELSKMQEERAVRPPIARRMLRALQGIFR